MKVNKKLLPNIKAFFNRRCEKKDMRNNITDATLKKERKKKTKRAKFVSDIILILFS